MGIDHNFNGINQTREVHYDRKNCGNTNRWKTPLSLFRGFLRIEAKGDHWKEIGRIPLDDIVAVVSNAHGITYTNNIMVELARRGIPFVLTSDDHEPVGVLWSVSSNSTQSKRIEA